MALSVTRTKDPVWHWWVVIPPADRERAPVEASRTAAEALVMQLPSRLIMSLMRLPSEPLKVLSRSVDLAILNGAMGELYNWADDNRVWLEWVE